MRVDDRQSRERGQRRIGARSQPRLLAHLQHADHDHRSDHRQTDWAGDVAAVARGRCGDHGTAGGRERHGHGDHAVVPRQHAAADGIQPEEVFNTLFGTTTAKERVLNARESDSLLDLILDRSKTFQSERAAHRVAFEQYLESVREIERRVAIVAATDITRMSIPNVRSASSTTSTSRSTSCSI